MPAGPRPDPPPGSALVTHLHTNLGHLALNTHWLDVTGTGDTDADDLQDVVDAIRASWATRLLPQMVSGVEHFETQLRWNSGSGFIEVVSIGSTTGGHAGSSVSDAGASCVVGFPILDSYRGGHPRMYLPGVPDNQVASGSTLTTGYLSGVVAAMENYREDVNALTATHITVVRMGTISFQRDNAWRATPVFRGYLGVTGSRTLGTQRRRIRG